MSGFLEAFDGVMVTDEILGMHHLQIEERILLAVIRTYRAFEPTSEELAAALGMTVRDVKRLTTNLTILGYLNDGAGDKR